MSVPDMLQVSGRISKENVVVTCFYPYSLSTLGVIVGNLLQI
jgi:hypothetical protein